ncbi:MAG: succinyl-diaminopimelate desuccinylase [Actinomycetes bacterium]
MAQPSFSLDLHGDVVDLTRALCDIESVSGDEKAITDAIEQALRQLPHLELLRDGNALMARTSLGRPERVVVAGHVDTVPLGRRPDGSPNLPTWVEGEGDDTVVHGRGTADMKAGVAVQLAVAARLAEPARDVTWVFYDCEEVEAARNGLGRLVREHPDWLGADFAVLCEPSNGTVEGGCNGTIRVEVRVPGVAAHSARAWMGVNAVHAAAEVLNRLRDYETQDVDVDGLVYRESLNAVGIRGGVAGNVVPDECVVTVNYRFAPSTTLEDAEAHLRELFTGFDVRVTDGSPGARPGLQHPAAAAFVAAIGQQPRPKYGWTDVARFSSMGVPAVNFGPGDPLFAHKDDEQCPAVQIWHAAEALTTWLSG